MVHTESASLKLKSIKGDTLLGVITIPLHWKSQLDRYGAVRFSCADLPTYRQLADLAINEISITVKHGTLHRNLTDGEVVLVGLSIEEFEKLDGCSFSPSAAYLRSLLD